MKRKIIAYYIILVSVLTLLLMITFSCNKVSYCSTYKSNYHNKIYNKAITKCKTYGE